MANHPITMISPAQIIQASISNNNDRLSPSNSSTPPTAGEGETSTGVSGGTEANVTVAPGTVAPDSYAMQANDSTAFVFGSTATNQAAAGNQYTTVDDTEKSSLQATMAQDQMIAPIGQRGARRPQLKKKKKEGESTTSAEEDEEEIAPTRAYSADAKKTLARAIEKGMVMM
ncbi:MAG: hypothetical protein K2W97_02845 [Chthoniobacterales bacterium]|nr:hypothetical protein [Chthoniobacterales bacterium]